MDRYATGEDAAFAELFRLLAPRLRAFLRRLSASDDIADDLLQETLLRIHHARGSFKPRPGNGAVGVRHCPKLPRQPCAITQTSPESVQRSSDGRLFGMWTRRQRRGCHDGQAGCRSRRVGAAALKVRALYAYEVLRAG